MKFRLMFCTTFFSLLAATSLQAAPITVPTSLNPGDQYRLAFVTSGVRDATSPFIADYNDFVQGYADAVPELLSLGVSWNAIGSTATVDARDNTGTNPAGGVGVPIFRLDDVRLVDDNSDLWDGSLLNELSVDEDGVFVGGVEFVWTGSGLDGSIDGFGLGLSVATYGVSVDPGGPWVSAGIDVTVIPNRYYGISAILTVVPEPSSFLLLSVAGMGAIVGYPSRARRRHRN
jgi:hypothetical protein